MSTAVPATMELSAPVPAGVPVVVVLGAGLPPKPLRVTVSDSFGMFGK